MHVCTYMYVSTFTCVCMCADFVVELLSFLFWNSWNIIYFVCIRQSVFKAFCYHTSFRKYSLFIPEMSLLLIFTGLILPGKDSHYTRFVFNRQSMLCLRKIGSWSKLNYFKFYIYRTKVKGWKRKQKAFSCCLLTSWT